MDFEIKKSLRVDNIVSSVYTTSIYVTKQANAFECFLKDENRCCLIMQDLIRLPFAKENLYIASEIVETIKKVNTKLIFWGSFQYQ